MGILTFVGQTITAKPSFYGMLNFSKQFITSMIIVSVLFSFQACRKKKKDNPTINPPSAAAYSPGKVGSYWIFKEFNVSATGVETETGRTDSVWIDSTFTKNGHAFKRYRHTLYYDQKAYADSANCIIGIDGIKMFGLSNVGEKWTIYHGTDTNSFYYDYLVTAIHRGTEKITLPIGTLDAVKTETNALIDMKSGPDVNLSTFSAYAKDIGMVMREIIFVNSKGEKIRFSLWRYSL